MYIRKDWTDISDAELVDALRWAACAGNEYDNHEAIKDAQDEMLLTIFQRLCQLRAELAQVKAERDRYKAVYEIDRWSHLRKALAGEE